MTGRQALWAYHPKPLTDESLSSWLCRIALGNSPRLHSFCNAIWPGRPIWNRDVDQISDKIFIARLATGTGTDFDRAWQTSLASFEGRLYDHRHGSSVPPLILHIGVYHRRHKRAGQQYCPICLRERPYFRRTWRLAISSTCLDHGVNLEDRCPRCGNEVVFHRSPDPWACAHCGFDLRAVHSVNAASTVLAAQSRLLNPLQEGAAEFGYYEQIPAVAFYAIARQMVRILSVGERSAELRAVISRQAGLKNWRREFHQQFEEMSAEQRRALLPYVAWLLSDWPDHLVAACSAAGVWHSWVLKDAREAGGFRELTEPVQAKLFHPRYLVSCDAQKAMRARLQIGSRRRH